MMKKLIIILFILISFQSFSQLTFEKKYKYFRDSIAWIYYDVIDSFSGNPVANDSVMYVFNTVPDKLNLDRIVVKYRQLNDTTYLKFTKNIKVEVLRSRKIVLYQRVYRYKKREVQLTNDEIIEQALKLAKNIKNNDIFWNYPLLDSIIYPVIFNDTIQ